MSDKYMMAAVLNSLDQSLSPAPHEVNELGLKASLSAHKDRLSEHLMAFANHPNGGSLVFGVADTGQLQGVDKADVAHIISA